MAYERYPRGDYNRSETQDYGRDYGSGRDYGYSSARDYAAAGRLGNDQGNRDERYGREDRYGQDDRYGRREYGYQRYGQREQFGREDYGRDGGSRDSYGRGQGYGGGYSAQQGYGARDRGSEYHGSYASDGRRFEDVGRYRQADDDDHRGRQSQGGRGNYGRQPQGYDYEERGFFQRAGDEVRSWFGDDDAERRREYDARMDERNYGGNRHDDDYHSWRSGQIAALDRDYDEYRQENRTKFQNEFSSWRTNRQGQRDLLKTVKEHQEVVGSDASHVGTVDKIHGDRIILTKNDADAGGRHHSIPSSWISKVDDKVTLSKTAEEAKAAWRDEESNQAMFGRNTDRPTTGEKKDDTSTNLNRSFSGTY